MFQWIVSICFNGLFLYVSMDFFNMFQWIALICFNGLFLHVSMDCLLAGGGGQGEGEGVEGGPAGGGSERADEGMRLSIALYLFLCLSFLRTRLTSRACLG